MSAVQYNDVDGSWWMTVYAAAAAVPVCHAFLGARYARPNTAVFALALILVLIALIRTLPEVNVDLDAVMNSVNSPMSAATPYIEGNRELFGGMIAMAIILSFRYCRVLNRSS